MYYSKDEFLKNLGENDGEKNIHLALEMKKFYSTSLSKLKEHFIKNEGKKYGLHEIINIGKERPTRIYLDIDFKTTKSIDKNDFLLKVCKRIKGELIDAELMILDSSDEEKISFHIIIKNYYGNGIETVGNWVRKFVEKNEKLKKFLDLGVYKEGWQLFRMGYTYKEGRMLKPINENEEKEISVEDYCENLEDYMVIIYDTNKLKDYKLIKDEKPKKVIQNLKTNSNTNGNTNRNEEINKIKELLGCLKPERCSEYYWWSLVGIAIYNHFKVNEEINEGLKMWKEWSKKGCAEKYSEEVCNKKWKEFEKSTATYSIGSLFYWAEEDNPEKYQKIIMSENLRGAVNDYEIAKLVHKILQNRFICYINPKNQTKWYYFEKNYYIHDLGNVKLSKFISEKMPKCYFDRQTHLRDKLLVEEDKEKKKKMIRKLTEMAKLMGKLTDNTYKRKLVDECRIFFVEPELPFRLNKNWKLFAFKNGVLDLETGNFRKGVPDDMITFHSHISFYEDLDTTELEKNFLEKILPNPKIRKYLIRFFAICMNGAINNQQFHFFTGKTGSNGKSTLINIIDQVFGDYATESDVTLFTSTDKKAGSASPERIKLINKRLSAVSEINKGVRFNQALFKRLTGKDKIPMRGLYLEDEIEISLPTKFVMLVNDLPELDTDSHAIWRRIVNVKFDAIFKENPQNPREFKLDLRFLDDEYLGQLAEQMAVLLFREYKEYLKEKVNPIPEEIQCANKEFQNKNNMYLQYAQENLEKSDDKDSIITLKELIENFNVWYWTYHSSKKLKPTKEEIMEGLKKYVFVDGEMKGNEVNKYKFMEF